MLKGGRRKPGGWWQEVQEGSGAVLVLGWGRWRWLGWLSCCWVLGGLLWGFFGAVGAGGCPQGWPWCAGLVWGCRTWSSYGGIC